MLFRFLDRLCRVSERRFGCPRLPIKIDVLRRYIQCLKCSFGNLSLVEPQEGPLFRRVLKSGQVTDERLSAQSMRLVVLQAASAAGLSLDLSAHSLRIGFVTTAIRQGKTERAIMNQTGHRSVQTLRGYFHREDAIEDNAAKGIMA